ncbi:(E)-beta-caryophyllene synthase-like isoform X4 [Panicum virgatum]|uniref:Uncharacterized protein n=1 Tax=Panicum virgatum TaxID=38727 RepID=A0A8T0W906_PANVG|nr:(E)-beta-caryophyllene synthase-like isoform X4 [Panicum virgatum]KAG2641123.1 hypothetical protein PVAP13_2KG150300 [Panicum virgatum]
MGISGSPVLALASQDEERKPRSYTPSIWGDFFLQHQPCTPSQLLSMEERAWSKQEEVRRILLDTIAASSELVVRKLELVDTLQRIGVDYHFRKEIDELLRDIHGSQREGGHDDELYLVSLRFYLLRKHGYNVSSDVFAKFKDDHGNFASNDAKCLLALYEAAHLRTRGEEILDNAVVFTRSRLRSMVKTLDPELAAEVEYTLETPSYRRVERVEARRYISLYEKKVTRNDTILEFAKLDYNILQALYCEELKALTAWWKGLQSQAYARFARDRVTEMHFWMLGVIHEPCQSYARIALTKCFKLVSLMDDFCDNYSDTEEFEIFITSLERWDEQAAEKLPAYMKDLFIFTLNTINDIMEELKLRKNKHAEFVKELFIDAVKRYGAERKWRDERYVPAKIEEHLQISVASSGCMHLANITFVLMGDVTTREAIEWAFSFPEMIRAACTVGRICNDIMSHEREQVSKHVASTVETCMKEYGMTVHQAYEKLRALIDEAWMDIVQGCLDQPYPMEILEKVVNIARTMDKMYKRDDAYTDPYSLKDTITSMYVNPV